MQISQTKEQIRALAALQEKCEIQDVRLLSTSAIKAKAGSEFKEPFSVKPMISNVAPSRYQGSLVVEVSFEYSAWDSSEPPERLFMVNCAFEVSYALQEDFDPSPEEISSFSRGTAVFNCWPYAREFLRDVTARMGHQTPALPLLRIVPKRTESSQQTIEAVPAHGELPEPDLELDE
jgi:hypothetical protein